jgi:ABC-type antimicrobial peptide transport system permease subunit
MIGESLLQDARVGTRVLLRDKGFCVLAIAVLALGICAVTTQFTVVNAVVLRGFTFPHPEQLVDVQIGDPFLLEKNVGPSVTSADFEDISDDYFSTLGVNVIRGRAFNADDNDDRQSVAVVNESFARTFSPREDAIGRQVRFFTPGTPQVWRTIVGVVPDMHMAGPFPQSDGKFIEAGIYTPLSGSQAPQFATVIVRPRAGAAEAVAPALARGIQRADPNLPLYFGGTPQALHLAILGQNQIVSSMFIAFGFAALLLSAAGLYGVMSFSVNQRTLEFGIRMALGARPGDIFRIVLRQGGLQLAIGVAVGFGAAVTFILIAGSNQIAAIMPFVSPRDPLIYGLVVTTLTLVALASCLGPANRATRVPPMVALRSE